MRQPHQDTDLPSPQGRERDLTPRESPEDDPKLALYVHLSRDGGILVVWGSGHQAWVTEGQLEQALRQLHEVKGRLIYSRDDPEHDAPSHVEALFRKMVDSRPAAIQLLPDVHPTALEHAAKGVPILHLAAYQGKTDLAADLVRRGIPLEERALKGYTPLMLAADKGSEDVARILLEAGAEANAVDDKGTTPLMFAAGHGYDRVVSLLLARGADATLRGNRGLSAADLARQGGHKSTLLLLEG